MAKGGDLVTHCQTHTALAKSCPVEGRRVETRKRLYFISRREDVQELDPPFPFSSFSWLAVCTVHDELHR